jgi:hypothetical protein
VILGLGWCLASGQIGPESDWNHLSSAQKGKFIVGELDRCPSWLCAESYEVEYRAAIVRICRRLSSIDTTDLRKGVREYWQEYCTSKYHPESKFAESTWNAAKVYVLIRVLFDVPDSVPWEEAMSTGQFNPPNRGQGVDMLWPLKKTAQGDLILVGSANGPYSGPKYDGLKDFEYVAKHFPRGCSRNQCL